MLARAAESAGVRRFVYCSSLAGCGPSRLGIPLTESDLPHPITPYGRSKRAGELAVQAALRNTEWIILRPPAVMGPRDEQFVPLFKLMSRWRVITEVGFRPREYSLIGVDDLVAMLAHAAVAEQGSGETLFATMPEPYAWRAVAEAFRRVSGKSSLRLVVPEFVSRGIGLFGDFRARVTNQPVLLGSDKVTEILGESWACSSNKMKRLWGVECGDDLDTVVGKTYRFYLQQKWI
ncbi:MAG: NAD-dependent epimerase/dehydratase family protein [bacterium]|nr:NAD-dependent epimerase/dehydratase family protein [bacterium]